MQNSDTKVIDLSHKYGYESPEAFTRAFKAIHGVSPSKARKKGIPLKAYLRISFLLSLKGDIAIDYRIEQKDGFNLYGIERIIKNTNWENWNLIPAFWMEIVSNGEYDKLINSTKRPLPTNGFNLLNAIDSYRNTGDNTFPYMIFAFKTDSSSIEGYTEVNVPSATWAIFKSGVHTREETSDAIASLIKRIYTDWLPTANYDKVEGYEFELTYAHDPGLDSVGIPDGAVVFGLFDGNYKQYGAPESIQGLIAVSSIEELTANTYCVLTASSGFSYVVIMSDTDDLTVTMTIVNNYAAGLALIEERCGKLRRIRRLRFLSAPSGFQLMAQVKI